MIFPPQPQQHAETQWWRDQLQHTVDHRNNARCNEYDYDDNAGDDYVNTDDQQQMSSKVLLNKESVVKRLQAV